METNDISGKRGSLPAIDGPADFEKYLPSPQGSGMDFDAFLKAILGAGGTALGGLSGGLDGVYSNLLSEQVRVQMQMQVLSFQSNIEKSKHETQMAAIRNMRVG